MDEFDVFRTTTELIEHVSNLQLTYNGTLVAFRWFGIKMNAQKNPSALLKALWWADVYVVREMEDTARLR